MNESEFKKCLVGTILNYGQEPNEIRVKMTCDAVVDAVGAKHNWRGVFTKLIQQEKFCPNAAVIVDYVRKLTGYASPADRAAIFVDRMISGFSGPSQDYGGIGKEAYNMAKDLLGVTSYCFRSGRVSPQYNRKAWVETMTRYYSGEHDKPLELSPSPEVLKLISKKEGN